MCNCSLPVLFLARLSYGRHGPTRASFSISWFSGLKGRVFSVPAHVLSNLMPRAAVRCCKIKTDANHILQLPRGHNLADKQSELVAFTDGTSE